MARKPTYKELEQKVKELEKEAGRRNCVQEELKTERTRLFALLDGLPAYVYLQAPDHSIRFANRCFRERFGEPEGKPCYQVITGRDKPCKSCRPFSVFETGRPIEWEWVRGDGRTYQIYDYPFSDIDGSPLVLELGIDITERKQAEESLSKAHDNLKAKSHRLKEVNVALKILLKQREDDKKDLEENVLSSVKTLVTPHLERLKTSRLNANQRALVGILESNLKNIVSPFVSKLSSKFLALSPMEIQVADLVKEGKANKDIAEELLIANNTVLYHRYHIRTKLGLRNRKINLRSYLLSLAK
jgi:DNA-binding CsgD family transcriptional regulator